MMTGLMSVLAGRMAKGLAPALALAIFDRGRIVQRGLLGSVDGRGKPPRVDTAFRIASCTKSFTAAAVLLLRERGLLALDDDVARYVPGLRVFGPGGDARHDFRPSIRHLLTMSAGLPTDDPWADRQESLSNGAFGSLLAAGIRLVRAPGTGYEYSNLGYALLGQVIEAASGHAYVDFIRTELLEPLGLSATGFDSTVPAPGGVAAGCRRDGTTWERLPFSSPGAFSAIGGLFSTLVDLGRWAAWLADGFGTTEEADIAPLSRPVRREMQQIHCRIPSEPGHPEGRVTGYGYGLVVHNDPRGVVVGHAGGYPGFSAYMRWHPATGAAVVGFENASYSGVGNLVRDVLDHVLDGAPASTKPEPRLDRHAEPPAEAPPEGRAAPMTAWPELLAARSVVERLVRNWDDALARSIFADNVELDTSLAQRRERLGAELAVCGPVLPLEGTAGSSATAAQLAWTMPAVRGGLNCFISLSPLHNPRVQSLDFAAVADVASFRQAAAAS
ncbi:MAG TPA: serine hydrolase domain-containing protein [Micrococcaceae bacterium]|nr:serine hydrolase domain-containing protein [Micrococcaceae bacterium]